MNFTNTCKPCNQGKENNILTAKEWLEENLPPENCWYECNTPTLEVLMERYASYKTKVLEDRILEFREDIKSIGITMEGCSIIKHSNGNSTAYNILNAYDRSFNITIEK